MLLQIITAVATVVSTLAYIITALYIRAELKAVDKDRFLSVTSDLFKIWQDPDFMTAQLWLLHKLDASSWEEFVRMHRADQGEASFHRVGSFYDRVGTLIRLKLVDEQEILSTVGGYAIAVWQKIDPLVREARRIENSVLFDDFERMLPACYECYVPSLGKESQVKPFSIDQPTSKISVEALKKKIDKGVPLTVLDVRQPTHVALDPRTIDSAIMMPPEQVAERFKELPTERDVVAFCA